MGKHWGARRTALLAAVLGTVACGSSKPSVVGEHELAPGEITTWAGTGKQGSNGDGLDRSETWLDQPMEMVFSDDGAALVVDWNNHCVRRVTTEGVFENVVGTDLPGDWPCQVPGDAELCEVPLRGEVPADQLPLNHPMDVALASDGSFYMAAWHNHKIESYDGKTQEVTIVAGLQKPGPAIVPVPMGMAPPPVPVGDGGPAATAPLNFPSSIVLQSDGSLLVSDERNNRVRRIATDDARTITTVAGTAADKGTNADGIAATAALLNLTTGEKLSGSDNPPPGGAIALDADGNLYIADTFHHAIRRVSAGADGVVTGEADEIITTVAGTLGEAGYDGDGGPATSAKLRQPFDIEIGPDAALYVADTENHVVRRVDLEADAIETIAGTGTPGFSGDDGPAVKAKLREPYGLAFDPSGDLYVVDSLNNRIRRMILEGATR
jgi:sugar lactone lactonase YvrE